jgi:hypothetical protein
LKQISSRGGGSPPPFGELQPSDFDPAKSDLRTNFQSSRSAITPGWAWFPSGHHKPFIIVNIKSLVRSLSRVQGGESELESDAWTYPSMSAHSADHYRAVGTNRQSQFTLPFHKYH